MSAWARWAGRLLLTLLGLALGLVGAELLARAVAPDGAAHLLFNAQDATPDGLMLTDREVLTRLQPGFEGAIEALDFRVHLRVNGLGLRGPPVDQPPVSSWLAIGDSFTFSLQVDEDQTFMAGLAERLGQPVWNGGVDGDSTWQSTIRYQRVQAQVAAETVLLVYFLGNDLHDNEAFPHRLRQAAGAPDGESIALRRAHGAGQNLLFRNSHLYAHWRVSQRAKQLASGADPQAQRWRRELEIFTGSGRGALQRLLAHTQPALAALAEATRGRGQRLIVALAPAAFQVDTDRAADTLAMVGLDPAEAALDAPTRAVAGVLAELGIQGCDLTPALRAAGPGMYFHFDGHWTPAGHAVVAEALHACAQATAPP